MFISWFSITVLSYPYKMICCYVLHCPSVLAAQGNKGQGLCLLDMLCKSASPFVSEGQILPTLLPWGFAVTYTRLLWSQTHSWLVKVRLLGRWHLHRHQLAVQCHLVVLPFSRSDSGPISSFQKFRPYHAIYHWSHQLWPSIVVAVSSAKWVSSTI